MNRLCPRARSRISKLLAFAQNIYGILKTYATAFTLPSRALSRILCGFFWFFFYKTKRNSHSRTVTHLPDFPTFLCPSTTKRTSGLSELELQLLDMAQSRTHQLSLAPLINRLVNGPARLIQPPEHYVLLGPSHAGCVHALTDTHVRWHAKSACPLTSTDAFRGLVLTLEFALFWKLFVLGLPVAGVASLKRDE